MFKSIKKAAITGTFLLASTVAVSTLGTSNAEAAWKTCASELGNCKSTQGWTQKVRFGAGGRYIYKNVDGNIQCTRAKFGGDPKPYTRKHCQIWQYSWKKCAGELKNCNIPKGISGTHVRFGTTPHKKGKYITQFVDRSSINCSRPNFKQRDPTPGKRKSCWFWNTPH